jgi:hypothetical protein
MTRVFDQPRNGGGTRILIVGASAYPHARTAKPRVPKLPSISSAAKSALDLASNAIGSWVNRFRQPLVSVDLLVDTPNSPQGYSFATPGQAPVVLDPPTLPNVKAARKTWMNGATAADVLLFYCCGHGIWLPATGSTFLTASFGEDEDNPWPSTIALDDFALALGEYPPRQQWLIFDCCNNTPTEALKAMGARADPLLTSVEGQRRAMEQAFGPLAQVTIASSTPGALSFGKEGRASRFMEAFLEACAGGGCRRMTDGKWWVDQQGIEEAMATYRLRIASVEEEDYFTFPRLTRTDAAEVPRLLSHDRKPACTLLVRSQPPNRLKQANLTIRCRPTTQVVGNQASSATALARFRLNVAPWLDYDLEAAFGTGLVAKEVFAMPPLVDTLFEAADA